MTILEGVRLCCLNFSRSALNNALRPWVKETRALFVSGTIMEAWPDHDVATKCQGEMGLSHGDANRAAQSKRLQEMAAPLRRTGAPSQEGDHGIGAGLSGCRQAAQACHCLQGPRYRQSQSLSG